MMEIEIVREYKDCWKVGQRREVEDHFAAMLIEGGYAKQVVKPAQHKMLEEPGVAK